MANLCTLRNRRLEDMAVLMYKTKNNICPKYIADLFYKIDTKYSLRNKGDLPSLTVFRQRIRKFDLNSLLADTHCSECILCRT